MARPTTPRCTEPHSPCPPPTTHAPAARSPSASLAEIATTPFRGIHADPPAGLGAADYRALLTQYGLEPAPGYFSAEVASDPAEVAEAAKRHAAVQAELGIAAVHLKDVHLDQARAAKDADANYFEATVTKHTVWTEPGRGNVDLLAAIATLPDTFDGWLIVEVDVPEAETNLSSTQLSAQWITDQLGPDVF